MILPAALFAGWAAGTYWNFSIVVLCFVIHPLICLFQKHNKDIEDDFKQLEHKLFYRITPLLFVPVLLFSTLFFLWHSHSLKAIEFAGVAISLGIINGVLGFTLAHEFVHKHTMPEKIAAWLLLLQNNYLHYGSEHVKGHHMYACTDADPHTAKVNESFYMFLPRSIYATFINAWKIEQARLRKKNIHVLHWQNKMLQHLFIRSLFYSLLISTVGVSAALFFIIQSCVAIVILHLADYLQHYGLLRKKKADHKYERITELHAWGNTHAKGGFNLFQLDKHADHHLHPSHSYETLVHHEESPELPAAYSTMMLMALIPKLWFNKMNKRIPEALLN